MTHPFAGPRSVVGFLVATSTVVATAAPSSADRFQDKTLVAWVSPANLTQRGGSVLTLEDDQAHFDGIVFGEIAPGRWMAGSEFFARTHRDQTQWPTETTTAPALVQIAVAYQGTSVRIYRNAVLYAEYTAGSPPPAMGPQSRVVIGKRHLDQGDDARFLGSIDDARIYPGALTAEQIAALAPNTVSEPKPMAWWDFSDGTATDRMGAFPVATLFGTARIQDGRLHLDTPGAWWLAARTPPESAQSSTSRHAGDRAARALRESLLEDPHRPGYHFVVPEGSAMPFDPNGAIFWKGRYHLFYIFQDHRGHNWGHVSSTDLFHWRHHPTGLVSGMFSGNCFLNREGRPTMCYHQVGQGNAMAVALDDELNTWKKLDSNPITPKTRPGDPHHDVYSSWDPFGWVDGDTYYAIFGGKRAGIAKAPTLAGEWTYVGDLLANTVDGIPLREDISCADFFRLGDRHVLVCISHDLGCRYYVGDWRNERFHPTLHAKMSWVDHAFFAPETLLDERGRRILWAWAMDQPGFKTRAPRGWSGTLSLPRVLTLGADGTLRMDPPEEIERLRYRPKRLEAVEIAAEASVTLPEVRGHSLELIAEFEPTTAQEFGVVVAASPADEEATRIFYDAAGKQLAVDTRRSSLTDGPKSLEAGPLALADGERLSLRVFVDRSIVEVFANGRQAVMRRIYPTRDDSVSVRLFSRGGPVRVSRLQAWEVSPSNPY